MTLPTRIRLHLCLLTIPLWVASTSQADIALPPGHEQVLFSNVQLLEVQGRPTTAGETYSVLIENGVIKRVATGQTIEAPQALQIDGQGKYLVPALIDAHVHIWDTPELAAYLAYGVTTVRNASGLPYHLTWGAEIASGERVGPRLLTTGPILNGQGPNTQLNHQIVSTAEQAIAAVQQQHTQGYRALKVYSNLSQPAYSAILAEADRLGMSMMGHTPEGIRDKGVPHTKPFRIPFDTVLGDGWISIEHIESIVWHALADDLDESKLLPLAQQIAKSGTPVTATLVAHRNLMRVAQTQGQFLEREGSDMLNPFIRQVEKPVHEFWSNQPRDTRKEYDDFYMKTLRIFHDQGVRLLAGSDAGIFVNVPGMSLIDELQLMVEAGLTPQQALATATIIPSEAFGLSDTLGRVKEGYLAELILVDGNPTENIAELWNISGVLTHQRWFDPEGIAALKQMARQTSIENSEKIILQGLAAQGYTPD